MSVRMNPCTRLAISILGRFAMTVTLQFSKKGGRSPSSVYRPFTWKIEMNRRDLFGILALIMVLGWMIWFHEFRHEEDCVFDYVPPSAVRTKGCTPASQIPNYH